MALQQWLKGLHQAVHHLPRSFYVAAVIASGVHILNGRGLPLELPATTLLAGVAEVYVPQLPPKPDARRHMALVEIDGKRFEKDYGETSPLDRCTLRADLDSLLQNDRIRVLAIDLDLSPIDLPGYQEAWRSIARREKTPEQMPHRHRCQYKLEQWLDESSRRVRIIAITPLDRRAGRDPALPWDNPHHFPHVQFGDPELVVRFGMVHDYEFPQRGYAGSRRLPFAEIITRELCAASGRAATDNGAEVGSWRVQPEHCEKVAPDPVPIDQGRAGAAEFRSYPISHYEARHLYNRGAPIGLDSCLHSGHSQSAEDGCDIRVVLLGGTYGTGDRHLTPVGEKSGLEMHGVIAAQVRAHTWHGLGFIGDVLMGGLIFGPLVHVMWAKYFNQRAGSGPNADGLRHPLTAYRWLLLLGMVYLFLVTVSAYFAVWLYAGSGVWISPVPIALAMMFEAAVSGSAQAAVKKAEDDHTTISGLERRLWELQSTQAGASGADSQASEQNAAPHVGRPRLAYLPRAVAVLLIMWVVWSLVTEWRTG